MRIIDLGLQVQEDAKMEWKGDEASEREELAKNPDQYFDADTEDCIYGREIIASPDYFHVEVDNLDELITEAKDNMSKEFGVVPKAYLMAHGW